MSFARVVLLVVVGCAATWAQTVGGTLRGTVHDTGGAVLPGVTITLRNPALGTSRVTTSDARGMYQFALLTPGIYELEAILQGFNPRKVEDIHVQVDQEFGLDLVLGIPRVMEKVEVKAETPTVEVTRSDLSDVVSQQSIYDLPLEGRQFTNLVQLLPGVMP